MKASLLTACPILFEDDALIAVDKPAGVLSHPNPGKPGRCAFQGRYHFDERKFTSAHGSIFLIHRLDQDTSGVLLAAKTEAVAETVRTLFEEQQIQKTYTALVFGRPVPPQGMWKDHLSKQTSQDKVRSVILSGRPVNAILKYQIKKTPLSSGTKLSLLEIQLITGKTHQIRVQTSNRKYPVAGDRIYGDFGLNRQLKSQTGLDRLFLHAGKLQFQHPLNKKALILESALPEELKAVLSFLAK